MPRYDNTAVVRDKNNKVMKRRTKFYKAIPEKSDDIYVMTQLGDRCDLLAHQYYNDASLWWYIAKANNLNFNNLEEGLTLRIPSSTDYV
tara:strand:+ start:82 stop:348 length:267 start_codon:yes stop_codon:yes gene_type:complete